MMDGSRAIAIVVQTSQGRRYFHSFGKKAQLQTAWSLAGATLFGGWRVEEIERVERKLEAKGYRRIERITIGLVEGPSQ